MFLEDKLQQTLDENKFRTANFGVTSSLEIDLLNVCVAHIDEHITPKDTWLNAFNIIKQTDDIWRTFAKKKGYSQDFFRNNYIIPRLTRLSDAKEYFKITKEEIEKYGTKTKY